MAAVANAAAVQAAAAAAAAAAQGGNNTAVAVPTTHLGSWFKKFATMDEQTWLQLGTFYARRLRLLTCTSISAEGSLSETMVDNERAIQCYESALRHNPYCVKALTQIASLYRIREDYPKVGGPSVH